ncbi:MAG TPA: transporter substrate-binding domain-containing protein [Gammaproteobacteria bacterium]
MDRVLVTLLLAVAWSIADARPLQTVLNDGTLRVGVALFAPWTVRDAEGELIGFEIDVGRQLAADMGVEAQFIVYPFERLIPALEAGEIDLIAAGLTITPERALHVNFSDPYWQGGVTLATSLERTANVERLEDLNDPAFRLAAVEGSVAAEVARRTLPRAELRLFRSVEAATEALLSGEVAGYLEDEPVPTFLALEHPDAIDVPLARPLLETRAAFAVAKGDPDFLAFLDAWIVARQADTWLTTTGRYWFQSLAWRQRVDKR